MRDSSEPRTARGRLVVALAAAVLVLLPAPPAAAQTADGDDVVRQLPLPDADRVVDADDAAGDDTEVGTPAEQARGEDDDAGLVEVPEVRDVPDVTFGEDEPEGLSRTVSIVLAIGLASLVPSLVLLMTTFTRYIVVLSLVKNALALQTVPPSQVLVGLALFLTAFTMGPTLTEVNEVALQPLLAGEVDQSVAWDEGFAPMRDFMLAQVRDEDLELFLELSADREQVTSREEVPALTLVPAFVISELRTAFTIGFMVFVPFLLIDLVVAAVLMSMGMVMVPPVFISLPLKLLLFVLVDGWILMVGALVQSVNPVLAAGAVP